MRKFLQKEICMQKCVQFIGVAILALFLAGCFGGNEKENAVKSFFEALGKGDLKAIQSLSTQSTAMIMPMAAAMKCPETSKTMTNSNSKDEYLSKCYKEAYGDMKIKIIETKDISADKAVVRIEETFKGGNMAKEDIEVEKFGDKWLVNIHK